MREVPQSPFAERVEPLPCHRNPIGEIDIISTTTVCPQPELTSTLAGKASIPLTSAVALTGALVD